MAGEREGHVPPAPVVAAAAPFLGAGALGLRRVAVVEVEARVALQRVQHRAVGEDERRADEVPAPVAAALDLGGVEEHQVMAGLGLAVVDVGRVEVADPVGRVRVRLGTECSSCTPSTACRVRLGSSNRALLAGTASGSTSTKCTCPSAKRMFTGNALTRYSRFSRLNIEPVPKKQLHRRIDRGMLAAVPVDPQERLAEGLGLVFA